MIFDDGDQGLRAAARGSRSSYQRSERCAATVVNLTAGTKPFALWRARRGRLGHRSPGIMAQRRKVARTGAGPGQILALPPRLRLQALEVYTSGRR